MAKANQRSGWRKSKTRVVAPTATEFGSRGRETRKLLFRVSMLSTLAIVLLLLLVLVFFKEPYRDVPLILSVVSDSKSRPASEDVLYTAPNPCAAEDVKLLDAWFVGGDIGPSQNVQLAGRSSDRSGPMEGEMLIRALTKPLSDDQNTKPGGPDGNMLAVYLCAHGFVDQGTPYLAVGDSRADDRSTWVEFDALFRAVKRALDERDDAGQDLRLVMFIDAARVGPQWDWGQFTESFSEECERRVSADSDRIAVILSSRSGQRSWWDPRAGHGLFTKALVEALTGKGDLDADGVVKVGEIADYLSDRVHQMSSDIWGANQRPVLAGGGGPSAVAARDWSFIIQPDPVEPPVVAGTDVAQLRSDFESVDELWRRHNALAAQVHSPLGFDPLGWAMLEKKMARLDALLLAGQGYRDHFLAMRDHCKGDLARFEIGPDSLPKPAALPELALLDYFHGEGSELEGLSPEQRGAFDELVKNWRTKKPDLAAAVQVPMTEPQAIRFLWSWLEEKGFDAESVELASTLLEQTNLVSASQPPMLLESQLVRLLASKDLSHLNQNTIRWLVDSQRLSRRAICPNDLRAAFWIRDQLGSLESQRRDCLDRWLSRNPDEQAIAKDRWNRDVKPAYASLIELSDEISAAYKLRDQMLHAIPRIAETLMNDSDAFPDQEELQASPTNQMLKSAIESLSVLSARLLLPAEDETRPMRDLQRQILSAAERATDQFDALNQQILVRLNSATSEQAGDSQGLRQNVALLVGSGTSRAELRERVHTRLVELIQTQSAAIGDSGQPPAEEVEEARSSAWRRMLVDGQQVWEFWLTQTENPSRIPGGGDPVKTDSESVDSDSLQRQLRDTGLGFRELAGQLSAGKLDGNLATGQVMQDPIVKSEQQQSLEDVRRQLEQWDTVLRSRTILFSLAPRTVQQIGQGRFALDQQLFLFAHARRTIQEFWCEAQRGDKPYFVAATNRLLSSRALNPLFSELPLNLDGSSLNDQLASASAAADAKPTLKPQPGEAYRDGTLLKFALGEEVGFLIDRPPAVPPGYASVWSAIGAQSQCVRLADDASEKVSVAMRVPKQLSGSEPSIEAELFFRGLRREGRIVFTTPTNGKRTLFSLPNYTSPMARVTRQSPEPERLLLVFDCSLSMDAATQNGMSRLGVAKNAVLGFLNGLDPDVEVGLIVFGDRYGFEEKLDPKTNQRIIVPQLDDGVTKLQVVKLDNFQVKPAGLIVPNEQVTHNPNFDVRVSVPLNPLDVNQIRTLKTQIQGLGAIGTTPTYLAIRRAYEQLGRKRGHIIVLTDGKPNIATTPQIPVNDSRAGAIKDFQQRQDEVKLTIVNYLAGKTDLEKDFDGATVLDAANGRALLRHLQNVRIKPSVVWERNREEASSRADFETLFSVAQWPPRGVSTPEGQPLVPAEPFAIRAMIPDTNRPVDARADVRVEGGEQFELVLADGRLSHQPFDYEYTQLQPLSTELSDASRFKVSAGPISERENRQLTIQLAIESAGNGKANGKFTPRPSDIWVELTGFDSRRSSRKTQEVYSFYLPEFQVRQPIPMLLCRIDDFSDQYDRVEVKAWMRFGDERLSGVSIPTDSGEAYSAKGLESVTFHTERSLSAGDGIRLTITEQYGEGREPGSLRVLSRPLPDSASTVVFADDRVVTRTFDFNDAETTISLSALSAQEVKRGSTLYASGTVVIDFDSR